MPIITPELAKHAKEYYDVLGLTNTPFFKDECGHPTASHVASFIIEGFFHANKDYERKIDLYVFKSDYDGQSLCLRTGNEPENYCSPGRVTDFIINNKNSNRNYRSICDLLTYLGRIKWESI